MKNFCHINRFVVYNLAVISAQAFGCHTGHEKDKTTDKFFETFMLKWMKIKNSCEEKAERNSKGETAFPE